MNESHITVKEYEFIKPNNHNIEYIIENVIGDCHDENYHKFEYRYTYDIKAKNNRNNAIIDLTISDISLNL